MPKLLVPVNGRPMIEHLLDLYARVADRVVIVVSSRGAEAVRAALTVRTALDLVVQDQPTGMLDAILLAARRRAARPRRVLDYLVRSGGRSTRARSSGCRGGDAAPRSRRWCCRRCAASPVHPLRSRRLAAGSLASCIAAKATRCRTRRDRCRTLRPVASTPISRLPEFAGRPASAPSTGERNFLPFIPWLARAGRRHVPVHASRRRRSA